MTKEHFNFQDITTEETKQILRTCKVCEQEYYADIDDNINLCDTCYLIAERQIEQGKIKDFNEYGLNS